MATGASKAEIDIQTLRAARRTAPHRPYEPIGGDSWGAESVEEVLRLPVDGWKRKPYPRVPLKTPLEWDDLCAADRSWTYHLHAWDPIGDILASFEQGHVGESSLSFALDLAGDWVAQHPSLDVESQFAWYDMAVGLRVYRLAYLIDVGVRLEGVPDEVIETLTQSLVLHFECLADDSRYAGHSNHGLYQAAGQLSASRRLPEIPGATEAREQGEQRLREALDAHFTSEGVHKEHSPEYHWMLSKTLRGLASSDLVEGPWLEQAHRRVQAALAWFILPNQRIAMFGDSGWKRCSKARNTEMDDPGFAFVASIGKEGVSPETTVRGFSESGYFVARDRWPEGRRDFERCSYLAQTAAFHSRVHKHADSATFVWYDRECELIVDGGRYGYKGKSPPDSDLAREGFWYSDPHRVYVESTRAHNAVEIDDRSQARADVHPYGSALRHWGEQNGICFSEVFLRYPEAIRHSRVLLFRPGSWVLVMDWLQDGAETPHKFVQRFQFAPELELDAEAEGVPCFTVPGSEERLWMVPLIESVPVDPVKGQTEPELLGWTSRVMHEMKPIWTAGFEARDVPGHRFATLLALSVDRPQVDTDFNAVTGSGRAGRFRWSAGDEIQQVRFARTDDGFELTSGD